MARNSTDPPAKRNPKKYNNATPGRSGGVWWRDSTGRVTGRAASEDSPIIPRPTPVNRRAKAADYRKPKRR